MVYLLEHCPKNPTLEFAESIGITKEYTEIISIGGGSTIDVGKWLAHKYNLKHTAIPTTAGTGSEVTKYCVLTVNGKKETFDLKEPDSYILDPANVVTLPEIYTLSSGLDALSQAFESYWSINATYESKLYAKTAIEIIRIALPESIKNPTSHKARMDMLIAANLAGRAINMTKTNVCHAISYPLTDIFDIPHGLACALSLQYFTKLATGIDLTEFLNQLPIPKLKYDKELIADIAIKNKKLEDFPHKITRQDIVNSL